MKVYDELMKELPSDIWKRFERLMGDDVVLHTSFQVSGHMDESTIRTLARACVELAEFSRKLRKLHSDHLAVCPGVNIKKGGEDTG